MTSRDPYDEGSDHGLNYGFSEAIKAIVRSWSTFFAEDELNDVKAKAIEAVDLAIRLEKSERGMRR